MQDDGSKQDGSLDMNWSLDVIADLAAAFRRDGFVKSAEMLDDLKVVLAQEVQSLEETRKAQLCAGEGSLKLVVN